MTEKSREVKYNIREKSQSRFRRLKSFLTNQFEFFEEYVSKGDAVNNKFPKNFQQCFLPKPLDEIKMLWINNWLNERSHRVGVNDLYFTIERSVHSPILCAV